jgi:hypothetical protein
MSLFRSPRYADGDRIEVDGAPVRLKVSGLARRVSLRLDAARREFVATAPDPRRLGEAAAFAVERRAWMAASLAELPQPRTIAPGELIEVLGTPCRLEAAPGRTRWRAAEPGQPRRLIVAGEGEGFSRAVVRALKVEARLTMTERTETWVQVLGRPMPVLAITDARALGLVPAAPRRRLRRPVGSRSDPLLLASGPGAVPGAGLCRRPRMRSPDRAQPLAAVLGGGAAVDRRREAPPSLAARQRIAAARLRAVISPAAAHWRAAGPALRNRPRLGSAGRRWRRSAGSPDRRESAGRSAGAGSRP